MRALIIWRLEMRGYADPKKREGTWQITSRQHVTDEEIFHARCDVRREIEDRELANIRKMAAENGRHLGCVEWEWTVLDEHFRPLPVQPMSLEYLPFDRPEVRRELAQLARTERLNMCYIPLADQTPQTTP